MKMTGRDWAMLLLLSVLWGGSFFLVEIALEAMPVVTLVALRIGIAALVLWCFACIAGERPPASLRVWRSFLVMGLINNVIPFSLIVWGQTKITSGLASILNATTPIFAVVVAGLMLRDEPATRNKIAGVAIGFVGVAVLIGPEAIGEIGTSLPAQLAVLLAALSYALAGVYGRRFHTMGVHPVASAAGQVTMSALMLFPASLLFGDTAALQNSDASVWAAVLALAVLSTAVAYVLYFRILATSGATNLMLVTFLIPVTAIVLGTLLLGETLRGVDIAGMGLIALALLTIDGRLLKGG